MALDKSRAAVAHRMQALQEAHDRLVATSPTPVTVDDLAEAAGLDISLVRQMLQRASWWTTEKAQSSRKEAYRRYRLRLLTTGKHGMQRARSARSSSGGKRRLTPEAAAAIREQLDRGVSLQTLAGAYRVSRNSILNIKQEKTWRVRPDKGTKPAIRVQVLVTDQVEGNGHLVMSLDLSDLLGKPARACLSRHRGGALVLEAATDGIPVALTASAEPWTLRLPLSLIRRLALPEGGFLSACSATVRHRLYLSDFPAAETTMFTVQEASKLLHHSRQWLEGLVARGEIPAFYDSFRRARVVRRADLPKRLDELEAAQNQTPPAIPQCAVAQREGCRLWSSSDGAQPQEVLTDQRCWPKQAPIPITPTETCSRSRAPLSGLCLRQGVSQLPEAGHALHRLGLWPRTGAEHVSSETTAPVPSALLAIRGLCQTLLERFHQQRQRGIADVLLPGLKTPVALQQCVLLVGEPERKFSVARFFAHIHLFARIFRIFRPDYIRSILQLVNLSARMNVKYEKYVKIVQRSDRATDIWRNGGSSLLLSDNRQTAVALAWLDGCSGEATRMLAALPLFSVQRSPAFTTATSWCEHPSMRLEEEEEGYDDSHP